MNGDGRVPYIAVSLAVVGLNLDFAFVRMAKDDHEGRDAARKEDETSRIAAASGTATVVGRIGAT